MGTNNTVRVQCVALFLSLAFLLGACGSPAANDLSALNLKRSTTFAATAALEHSPAGTLQMMWNKQTHALTVMLSLVGLVPKSVHPAHIHAGSCGHPGKVVYDLKDVVADTGGVARATTRIASVRMGIPTSGWYVNIHNGPGLAPATQFMSIACADATHPAGATKVVSTLVGTADPNQSASGTARLSTDGKRLTVLLALRGLAPGSQHAAHIHAGSCADQGKPIYMLKPLVADASGVATSTTTIEHVSSIARNGWYITVHLSTNLGGQTGSDPIACGDVLSGQ